jgi:hypothetical protein
MDIETFYNTIADEFNKTRVRLWDCVKNYLDTFEPNSYIIFNKKLIFILFILLINA